MRRKNFAFFLALLIFSITAIFQGCASKNQISSGKSSFESIHFGKSGGFANLTEKYLLIANGTVYKLTEEKKQEINHIKKSQLRKIKKQLSALNYESLTLNKPGNMTYFIGIISNGKSNEFTWADARDHPEIQELYNTLIRECLID